MIHPLFRMLATRPELLAEHLSAYAQLVSVEAAEATAQVRRQALWGLGLALSLLLGLGLGGAALLLVAAIPLQTMPSPWLLMAVPAAPFIVGLACWGQIQRQPLHCEFELLRQQLALDSRLLREAGDA